MSTGGYYFDPPILHNLSGRDYFIRLLSERHGIRAALENPGGSVILTNVAARTETEASQHYSSMVGNDLHCDLIEVEKIIDAMPAQQRKELLEWVDRLPSREAAAYTDVKPRAIRYRRERAIEKAVGMWEKAQEEA